MQPGTVVGGRFTVEREAGVGGMGTVYAARDAVTGALVALKVLGRVNDVDRARFLREARTLAETDHPSVVRYVTHGATPAGEPYLAMEWLEGVDLAARLATAPLTTSETVRLARRVAEALAALHARGIVHRDVKPSNVFLVAGSIDRIKLLDLGVARVASRTTMLTRAGAIVGTPGYMAPEQVRGADDVSAAADVFALGCVLFECLTARPAFEAEHVVALLAKILLAEPPRVRDVRPEVPAALDELCAAMLRKEPTERLRDADAVLAALDDVVGADDEVPAARRSAPRAPALTTGEERLVCVLLAGEEPSLEPNATLAPTLPSDTRARRLDALQSRVTDAGLRVDRLVDGSIVGVPRRDASATEQAVAAARAALLLRAELPSAPIAIATGRSEVSAPVPVGAVIDRAVSLFRASGRIRPPPIALDAVTAGLLSARFEIESTAEVSVLVTERADASTSTETLLGKETPFVGRERETALIEGLLEECVSEPLARAAIVTAPAGVGKSRLRREVVSRAVRHVPSLAVWIGRADPMRAGSPFALLGKALRHAAGLTEGEDAAASTEKLRAHLAALGVADPERVAAFAGEIAGAPSDGTRPDVVAARRDPQLMSDQLLAAWSAWLDAETRAHPVLLVLEDLHWGDAPTMSFVDHALRTFSDRPLFVLGLARPEVEDVFPKLWAERNVQPVPLRELTKKASEMLVRHAMGARSDERVVSEVVRRAMGNPFFLEELVRRAAEQGDTSSLPETILAIVESRLDALDPDGRRVLRAASIFGETFHEGGVRALLGDEDGLDLPAWLDLLVRRESIVAKPSSSVAGDRELAFRHALVREAAYAMLTERDRKLGHVLAGQWLESRGVNDAALLAEHYELGGMREQAARWFAQAAQKRLSANDLKGALAAVARGLACADARDDRVTLLLLRAEVHRWLSEREASATAASEVIALVDVESPAWWAAMEELIDAANKIGRIEEATRGIESIEQACERRTTAPREAVSAVAMAANTLVDLGRYEKAERLLQWCDSAAKDALASDRMLSARIAHAHGRLDLAAGDVVGFLDRMTFAQAVYAELGAMRYSALWMISMAYGAMLLGRYAEAAAALQRSLDVARSVDIPSAIVFAQHNLGFALLRLGRLEESLVVERAALEQARAEKHPRLEGACLYYLSLAHHEAGDFDAAEAHALESARVCEAVPPSRAEALAALAQARLSKGEVERGLEAAREAKRILDEVGGIDEGEPLIRLVYAKASHASGAVDEARAAIADARTHLEGRASKLTDEGARATFFAAWENAQILALARAWTA